MLSLDSVSSGSPCQVDVVYSGSGRLLEDQRGLFGSAKFPDSVLLINLHTGDL